MQPINFTPISNNKYSVKTVNPSINEQEPSFTGLNSFMQRSVHASPELMQKVMGVFVREKGYVGTLPREMISILRQRGVAPTEMGKTINEIKSQLSATGVHLRNLDLEAIKSLDSFNVGEYFDEIFRLASLNDGQAMEKLNAKIMSVIQPSKECIEKLAEDASQMLTKSMKDAGILPADGKVQINYLGEGMFGRAYKVSFLDENGQRIFHDKALKVYKDQKMMLESQQKIIKVILDYLQAMPKEEFIQKFAQAIDATPALSATQKNQGKEALTAAYEQISKAKPDELAGMVKAFGQHMGGVHGATAEANSAMFIKKAIGHPLEKSNLITPYFFDLQNNIGFMDMADEFLPAVTKPTDFSKLGISHGDIDLNPNNTVAGRIIDYGGIQVRDKNKVISKTARRQSKRMSTSDKKAIKFLDDPAIALLKKNVMEHLNQKNHRGVVGRFRAACSDAKEAIRQRFRDAFARNKQR